MNSVFCPFGSHWLPLGGPWAPLGRPLPPEFATGHPEFATGSPEFAPASGGTNAARTLPSTRAGRQDDVSFTNSLKLPVIILMGKGGDGWGLRTGSRYVR